MPPRLALVLPLLCACGPSVEVKIENEAPEAKIISHEDGDAVAADLDLRLIGTVSDAETEPSALSAAWYDSGDEICPSLAPDEDGLTSCDLSLSEGEHTLTLLVIDAEGATGTDEVRLVAGDASENTAPGCTIMEPEDGATFATGETVSFAARVSDAESSPDLLDLRWSSDLDGELDDDPADAVGEAAFSSDELSAGTHTVTLAVSDPFGATCTDTVSLTVGDVPSVTIRAPSDGGRHNQGEELYFEGLVASGLTPADELLLSWTSDLEGVLSDDPADAEGTTRFQSDALSPGEHTITLYATDTLGATGSDTTHVTINGWPSAPEIALSPEDPDTDDDLSVTLVTPSVDPEGATVDYNYVWTRDGASTAYTDAELPASATSEGETWTVTVTPSDGEVEGPSATASLSIGNAAPKVTSISLSPTEAYTDDTLTVSATTSDPDGDTVYLSYVWTVDGATVSTATTLSGASAFDKGELVKVTITPRDADGEGDAVSASTTILNSAPEAPEISLSPELADGGEDPLYCEIETGSADADADAITYTILWTVDGDDYPDDFPTAAGPETTEWADDTVPAADSDLGEAWTCVVTPNDGEEDGESASAETTAIALEHLGYDESIGSTGSAAAGYLLGWAVTVPSDTTLYGMGAVLGSSGASMRMALYTNSSSTPGTLVAYTDTATTTSGANEIDLTSPVELSAGTYWIMANYGALTTLYYGSTSTVTLRYRTYDVSSTPPSSFGSSSSYTGKPPAYYLIVGD